MAHILSIVLPLFAIIGVGRLAIQFKYLDAAGNAVLSRFAFMLPVPSLLFGVMAEGPAPNLLGPGGIYFVGCLLVYAVALWAAGRLNNPSWPHRAVFALDTTFGNIVFLGTPLVLALYGPSGLSVLVGMMILTTRLLPISSFLMEIGEGRQASKAATVRKIAKDLLKSPAVYPVILGLCWRATGAPLPAPVHLFVDLFAKSAAPIALFCVGASLPPISWDVMTEAASAAVTPVVVAALCIAAGFTDEAFAVPVVAAALPTGANAFLLARGSTSHAAVSATTVVVATTCSLITLSVLLYGLETMR